MSDFELYKLAVEQFREQPRIYWLRARFFVTIQSALLSFIAFQMREGFSPSLAEILVTFLGFCISIAWFAITLASRKLIGAWRKVVIELEDRRFHLSDEASSEPAEGEFAGLFKFSAKQGEGTSFSLSITSMMNILAVIFVLIWAAILAAMIYTVVCPHP